MSEFKTFDVEITTTKTVRVRVPLDPQIIGRDAPEKVAEEFAQGGKAAWPEYVLDEEEDTEVDAVNEVETA